MYEFQRSIEEAILNADSLIIREGRFAPNERGEFVRLSEDERTSIEEVNKLMNWKGSYRVYFSIPYRLIVTPTRKPAVERPSCLDSFSERPPVIFLGGTPDTLASMFNEVIPQWTRKIEDLWLDSKFRQLDKKYEDIWSNPSPRIEGESDDAYLRKCEAISSLKKEQISSRFHITIEIDEGDKEAIVVSELRSFHTKMLSYLEVLDLEETVQESVFELYGRPFFMTFRSAIIGAEKKVHLFTEFIRHGLKHYVDENGCLRQSPEMNCIMEEVSRYMLVSGTDICFISDAEVWILVQLDFEAGSFDTTFEERDKSQFCTPEPPKRIPFKYRVFYMNEAFYPLQAIICSLAYDQKIRTKDPVQKDNMKKLQTLIVNKNPNPLEDTFQLRFNNDPQELPYPGLPDRADYQYDYDQDELPIFLKKGEYEAIQLGGEFLTAVFKLNRKAIDRNLSHLNIPRSTQHVILKLYKPYNNDYVGSYVSKEYLERYTPEDGRIEEGVERYFATKFNLEAECYERINRFNKTHSLNPIKVPKMYGHERMKLLDQGYSNYFLASGWGLILEYIEKDDDQTFSKEEAKHQVELLRSLGIEHNAIFWRNIIVSGGEFHLIDFSEATLKDWDEELSDTADEETPKIVYDDSETPQSAFSEDSNEESISL